ncbi:hypothetical protein D3C80_1534780 [compost metagenome]
MHSIADRLDDAFRSLSEDVYPTAIELSPDDAVAFQAWIDVHAQRTPLLIGDRWRFGGIPVTRIDARASRVICQFEVSAEAFQITKSVGHQAIDAGRLSFLASLGDRGGSTSPIFAR